MTNRSLRVIVATLALLFVLGCQSKGPTPKKGTPSTSAASEVGSIETVGTHPAVGSQDPHAGMVPTQVPLKAGAGSGMPEPRAPISIAG